MLLSGKVFKTKQNNFQPSTSRLSQEDMKESKRICYKILAKNRYASCPQDISKRQFAAVRSCMIKKFVKERLATPSGLYTDSEIWSQTFRTLM